MKKRTKWLIALAVLAGLGYYAYTILLPSAPVLDDVPNPTRNRSTKVIDESKAAVNELKNAYFGDLHIHTNFSFDAYLGGTIATPSDAYRYAKGEKIEIFGTTVQLRRPLDFAAVTDHSEFIGEFYSVQTPGKGYYNLIAHTLRGAANDTIKGLALFERLRNKPSHGPREHMKFFKGYETTKKAWDIILEANEAHYQPGKFTTLVGYEWSHAYDGAHLHRNVIFKDMIVPDYPVSSIEARDVEALWNSLATYEKSGASVLAIPHNSNLSRGLAFADKKQDGSPIDKAYVEQANKYEPLVEIFQVKGNSEVHPMFWKNDEFANIEQSTFLPPKEASYVRYALKKGLEYEDKLGKNPFKYGLMGSTDTHNATGGNTEENGTFMGNHTVLDVNVNARLNQNWVMKISDIDDKKVYEAINPGGLVAVWAKTNIRTDIWNALKNKETYGTSGNRMKVRFFGGYAFDKKYDTYETFVNAGYNQGVPMGGDLMQDDKNRTPSFLIWAMKDPESANLDRLQVIKGWYKNGQLEEKIYNVALSDNRKVNADGSVPDNGATVNLQTGEWSKDKGATNFMITWTDPDFDPAAKAFYYVRVVELPSARFTLWDQIRYNMKYPAGTPLTVRELAWSSPIWYNPK